LFLLLQFPACGDQHLRAYAHRFGDGDKVRLVRLQEPDQRCKKHRIGCALAKLICPDSGQVKEPPARRSSETAVASAKSARACESVGVGTAIA
jgi:hypothetical protein